MLTTSRYRTVPPDLAASGQSFDRLTIRFDNHKVRESKGFLMHVIIIGGGTGGMCLAHGLKRAGGVSVAVYERYGARDDGLYGYRVGIDPTGNRALRECLPPAVYQRFVDTCATPPRRFNVYSGKLRRTASFDLPDTTSALDVERSVSRATLRQVLFTG